MNGQTGGSPATLRSPTFTLQLTELNGDTAVPGTRPSLVNLTLTHRRMLVKYLTKMTVEIRQ